jgi:adenylate cyclase
MQLRLFSKKESRSIKRGFVRNSRKHLPVINTQGLDLWTQGAEVEKEMALLFLDIRNFTPLVEGRVASDVVYLMKKLFTSFQNIIRHHHGRIIETTGDGFYAAFGFHDPIDEAVNHAALAANAILRRMKVMNEQSFERNLKRRLDIGMGLHKGKVATAILNFETEARTLVMGYPVNVAARLQSATKMFNNNFIMSADVFHLLQSPPSPKQIVWSQLKGMSYDIQLYLMGERYS